MKKRLLIGMFIATALTLCACGGQSGAAQSHQSEPQVQQQEQQSTVESQDNTAVEEQQSEAESQENTAAEEQESAAAQEQQSEAEASPLEDGTYTATFTTNGSMFHVNETLDDKGELTVKDGKMTIHVSLASDGIVNLYPGLASDAQKDGAKLLQPSKDEVKYDDGTTETVNGFDVPVPYLDKEFDVAIIGKKGKWYDHKVMVSVVEN